MPAAVAGRQGRVRVWPDRPSCLGLDQSEALYLLPTLPDWRTREGGAKVIVDLQAF